MTKAQKACCDACLHIYTTYTELGIVPFPDTSLRTCYVAGQALHHAQEEAKARRQFHTLLNRMPPWKVHVKQWIAALRSGTYNQSTGYLKGPAGYCCLGVACELYGKGKFISGGGQYRDEDKQLSGGMYLSDKVSAHFNLSTGMSYRLGCMNDQGSSFAQIADVIEQELLNGQ